MRTLVLRQREILTGLLLVVMTALAYLPAIQDGGFIWDDDDYVTHNTTLRDVGGLKEIWGDPQATPQYYPLVHTSFWMEYQLWQLDPRGYHIVNVLLHALAAVLLWRVLRRLDVPGAWIAAALFAVHPVHVESVAWVTERKNVLSGVCYLGAALSYLRCVAVTAEGRRSRGGYVAAFILFLGALLSKTVTATLPAALLLVLWWQDARPATPGSGALRSDPQRWRKHVLALMPFFLVGLLFSWMTVWLETHHVGAAGAEWELSLIDRFLIAGRAVWFYAGTLLWPTGLCFNYPRWDIDAGVWWQYLFPLTALAAIVGLWFARAKLGRGPLVALLFFGGTLLPALGFFDIYPMRYSFVADHFQYLASIGIFTLVGAALVRVCRLTQRPVLSASALPVGAIVVLCATLTTQQCGVYRNVETLWLDTIEKNPASWMAYNNLGQHYILQGKPAAAIPLLEKVLDGTPEEVRAHNNMGVALSDLGRKEDAVQHYRQAIAIDPDDAQAYYNIGAVRAKQGRFKEAILLYRKALLFDPTFAAAYSSLGSALASSGDINGAVRQHEHALELMPDLGAMHLRYGQALQAVGRIRDAQDSYRRALSLDPSLSGAHYLLGLFAAEGQLLPAALHHFRLALQASPDFADGHSRMAMILTKIERHDEADRHFRESVRLAPESAEIATRYADFLFQRGDTVGAGKQFTNAIKLAPDNPDLLFQGGIFAQKTGQTSLAEQRFRGVLKAGPDHAAAHSYLAFLLAGRGDYEEAIQLLRKAVALEPGNAEFHNNLGVILVRHGNLAQALVALDEALRLIPDYSEAKKNRDDLRTLMESRREK